MTTPTPNYGFQTPTGSDPMSDVKKYVTDNFKAIELRNDITVIAAGAALPQTGVYNIGDRVFRNDPASGNTWPSNYILVCKDTNWGWHWRPIQNVLSPWVDVPAAAINDVNFEIHPTTKLQIALDSRGFCHWRGVVRQKTAGIAAQTAFSVFKNIPLGLRSGMRVVHILGLSPITGSSVGRAGNISGRFYMDNLGNSNVMTFNSNNGVTQNIWFDGLSYNNSYSWYLNA